VVTRQEACVPLAFNRHSPDLGGLLSFISRPREQVIRESVNSAAGLVCCLDVTSEILL
jgi:hypothetical protein